MFEQKGQEKIEATFSNVSNEFRYLDSNQSVEGPPSKRFYDSLERKVCFVLFFIILSYFISIFHLFLSNL